MCLILPEQGDISHIQLYAVFTLQVVANATEANIQTSGGRKPRDCVAAFSFSLLSVLCFMYKRRIFLSDGTCDQVGCLQYLQSYNINLLSLHLILEDVVLMN